MRRGFAVALILAFMFCLRSTAGAGTFVPDQHLLDELNDFITYRSSLSSWGMSLWFNTAVDSADVEALSFQQAFKAVWGHDSSSLVTSLTDSQVNFGEREQKNYAPLSGEVVRPGVYLHVPGRAWGNLLAMSYRWNYTWAELKNLLGGDVTGVPEVSRLFQALTVVFTTTTGDASPIIGAGGVDAKTAVEKGALSVWENGTGISITMNVCLTNIWNRTAKQGPQFVENLLLVPDGAADTLITGTLWMVEKKGSAGTGAVSSSSGGGGCNAGLGGMALMAAVFLRLRYKNDRGSSTVQGQAF